MDETHKLQVNQAIWDKIAINNWHHTLMHHIVELVKANLNSTQSGIIRSISYMYIHANLQYSEPRKLRTTFSGPTFLTNMLESNVFYDKLLIDILSV